MRTTMTPVKVRIRHADPGDEGWTHTLEAEDQGGASIALLLSGIAFQQLWAACESPLAQCQECGSDEEGLELGEYTDEGDASVGYGPITVQMCNDCARHKGLL